MNPARLQVYGYWNQGGLDNVTAMLCYLVDQYFMPTGLPLPALVETPPTGALPCRGYRNSDATSHHSLWAIFLLGRSAAATPGGDVAHWRVPLACVEDGKL